MKISREILKPGTRTERHHELGYVDSYGRMIGALCAAWEVEFVEVEVGDVHAGDAWRSSRAPGLYFVFRPWAARNGEHYGAVQREQYFTTERARELAMAKYLAGAKARAGKVRGAKPAPIAGVLPDTLCTCGHTRLGHTHSDHAVCSDPGCTCNLFRAAR